MKGRANAQSILALQSTTRKLADPIAVYDARRYMFRDVSAKLNRIWQDALKTIDPEQSALWKMGRIESFEDVYIMLGERFGAPLDLKLRDIAAIYVWINADGDVEKDIVYNEFANAMLDADMIVNRADQVLGVFDTNTKEKVYKASLFQKLRTALDQLMDAHENGELDGRGAMFSAVQKIAKICKQGIKITSPEGFNAITKKVFGQRPTDRPRARAQSAPVSLAESSNRKPKPTKAPRRQSAGGKQRKATNTK